jgi:guanylate kinase
MVVEEPSKTECLPGAVQRRSGTPTSKCECFTTIPGKLPLLELEAEDAEALKARGVDCLTIFLMPASCEAYERRLRAWMTLSDAEIEARQVGAKG